jgi:hypothetical protein
LNLDLRDLDCGDPEEPWRHGIGIAEHHPLKEVVVSYRRLQTGFRSLIIRKWSRGGLLGSCSPALCLLEEDGWAARF